MRRFRLFLVVAVALSIGCVGGPRDRCFVQPIKYREARRAFERTGSVALVREALEDDHWPNCQINEAIYRIEKEFGLYDRLASPRRARSEEELLKEEAADKTLRSSGVSPLAISQ